MKWKFNFSFMFQSRTSKGAEIAESVERFCKIELRFEKNWNERDLKCPWILNKLISAE